MLFVKYISDKAIKDDHFAIELPNGASFDGYGAIVWKSKHW